MLDRVSARGETWLSRSKPRGAAFVVIRLADATTINFASFGGGVDSALKDIRPCRRSPRARLP